MPSQDVKLFEGTAVETAMNAMETLSQYELEHGNAEGCIVIFLHRGNNGECFSGAHNVRSHTTLVGMLEVFKHECSIAARE